MDTAFLIYAIPVVFSAAAVLCALLLVALLRPHLRSRMAAPSIFTALYPAIQLLTATTYISSGIISTQRQALTGIEFSLLVLPPSILASFVYGLSFRSWAAGLAPQIANTLVLPFAAAGGELTQAYLPIPWVLVLFAFGSSGLSNSGGLVVGECPKCRYSMPNAKLGDRCPECAALYRPAFRIGGVDPREGSCANCGYDVSGKPVGSPCPQCQTPSLY